MNRLLLSGCMLVLLSSLGCAQSKLAKLTGRKDKDASSIAQIAFEETGGQKSSRAKSAVLTSAKVETPKESGFASGLFDKTTQITKIRPIWSEAALSKNGKPVIQGLMCKIYLFGPDSKRPQQGVGSAHFFGFHAASDNVKPDQEWVFKAEEIPSKYNEDAIGGGYRFFLPWGDPSDKDVKCRVAVRFDLPDGKSILSPFTLVTMPGIKESKVNGEVVQANHTVTQKIEPKVELGGILLDE